MSKNFLYSEEISLFRLEYINYQAFQEQIDLSNKHNYVHKTVVNMNTLRDVLILIRKEAQVVHKEDFPITFAFNTCGYNNGKPNGHFQFISEKKLYPHLYPWNHHFDLYNIILDSFNERTADQIFLSAIDNYCEPDQPYGRICTDDHWNTIHVLKQLDYLLSLDGILYNHLLKEGLYPGANDDFHTLKVDSFSCDYTSLGFIFSNQGQKNIFSINYNWKSNNKRVLIKLLDNDITLKFNKFMSLDRFDFERLLLMISDESLSFKTVDQFKRHLVIKEIESF